MKKFFRSFRYAWNGIAIAVRDQQNLKVQSAIAATAIGAGFYFEITPSEWCFVLLSIGLVMGLEMVNSAIENVVDLVTRDHHPLAANAKDIAAGAVLFAAVLAVIVGVLIFYKYLFSV